MASKETISKKFKDNVWHRKFGDDTIGLCCCCIKKTIHNTSFSCGHIRAEAKGGQLHILNMLPICHTCNQNMGQVYMPYYIDKHFGRDLFHEIDSEMKQYQHKMKNVVDYDISLKKGSTETPKEFVEPIEPVFEHLIRIGYINPNWTDDSYKQYELENRTGHNEKTKHILINANINGIVWKEIYISYSPNFREMKFSFTRSSTDDFPEYYWSGWIYLEKCKSWRKLTNYPIYIDRYTNWDLSLVSEPQESPKPIE
jgi:hypothetical protein